MNQKLMLYKYVESSEQPQSLDQIMDYIEKKNKNIPRSTIRARLSELRLRGIKIDDQIRKLEKNDHGWIVSNA